MITGLSQFSELPMPKRGDELYPWIVEMVRRINRRVEGFNVHPVPQGWLVGEPEPPQSIVQDWAYFGISGTNNSNLQTGVCHFPGGNLSNDGTFALASGDDTTINVVTGGLYMIVGNVLPFVSGTAAGSSPQSSGSLNLNTGSVSPISGSYWSGWNLTGGMVDVMNLGAVVGTFQAPGRNPGDPDPNYFPVPGFFCTAAYLPKGSSMQMPILATPYYGSGAVLAGAGGELFFLKILR